MSCAVRKALRLSSATPPPHRQSDLLFRRPSECLTVRALNPPEIPLKVHVTVLEPCELVERKTATRALRPELTCQVNHHLPPRPAVL